MSISSCIVWSMEPAKKIKSTRIESAINSTARAMAMGFIADLERHRDGEPFATLDTRAETFRLEYADHFYAKAAARGARRATYRHADTVARARSLLMSYLTGVATGEFPQPNAALGHKLQAIRAKQN